MATARVWFTEGVGSFVGLEQAAGAKHTLEETIELARSLAGAPPDEAR